jgi:NADH:ubiquinone oxidoreductase subunit 5 (subunit L)/multisubunit Na+/H+ antiporter MnhA subunit
MLWSLPLAPVLAAIALLAGRVRGRLWLGAAAVAVLLLTLLLSVLATIQDWSGSLAWSDALRLQTALTPLSATVAILVPTIALPVLAYAAAHEVFVASMELLVIANDLLTLLIGWELVGACSWALIGHEWRDLENPRSGLYAFLTTRLGDLGLFVAAMATFAASHGFAYDGLRGLGESGLSVIAFGVLLSAAAKSGQVPFSPWLFRAMAGPTSVSALLHAATMVAAGAYLVARLRPVLSPVDWFDPATTAVGLATALAGGLVALLQNHAKKLLAASTSAHFGLTFVAVGAGYPGVAILYLVAHAGFKALLFLAAGVAGERAGSYALNRMRLGRALPVMAALSAVGTLALAGIPPLDGGWTKEAVVSAASHRDELLAAACMVAGGLSAAYAVRFQLLAYGLAGDVPPRERPVAAEYVAIGALAAFSLLLSALWLPRVHEAVGSLLGAEIPPPRTAELVASLALVGLGLLTGLVLARRYPAIGVGARSQAVAGWLGLPSLISLAIVRPFEGSARAAAWIDQYVVDLGVRLTAAFGEWLAGVGERIGERLSDGLPEGTASLVGISGGALRRLQTSMSHHYYVLLAVGAAAMAAILFAGS